MGNPKEEGREETKSGEITAMTPLWVASRHLLSERGEEFFLLKDKVVEMQTIEAVCELQTASWRLSEALYLFESCYPLGDIRRLIRSVSKLARAVDQIQALDTATFYFLKLTDQIRQCRHQLVKLSASLSYSRDDAVRYLAKGTGKATMGRKPLREQYLLLINSIFLSQKSKKIDLMAPVGEFVRRRVDEGWADVAAFLERAADERDYEAHKSLKEAVTRLRFRLGNLSFLTDSESESRLADVDAYRDTLERMCSLASFSGMVRAADLSSDVEQSILDEIMRQHSSLFAEFQKLLLTTPVFSAMPVSRCLARISSSEAASCVEKHPCL